ncbi:Cof-type HAD-IIB family hydrolase [Lentilactobacillus fungorum]|uniref:Cof-type HAD-IIB family hydrolase n=1 Tax=Lentilactobacillus fungorum TaxID=2201250 RepID=A0ABQ3VYS6_9LACO|nr:Cof-type HAD-IIB family hydrolase [Lentilactobacillus fungorum]
MTKHVKFVFDVDGTISFDGRSIDSKIIEKIQALTTNRQDIIFASARPIRDLLPIINGFSAGPLIGGNGSIISVNGQVQVVKSISLPDYELLRSIIQSEQLDYLVDGSWNYSARVTSTNAILNQLDQGHLARKVPLVEIKQPIKVILLDLSDQLQASISAILKEQTALSIVEHQQEHNLDLTAQGVNKFTTLQQLFPDESYVAFGNDVNDSELMMHAKRSVWIGRSPANDFWQPDFNGAANVSGVLGALSQVQSWLNH